MPESKTRSNVEPIQLRAALKYAKAGYPIVMVHSLDAKGRCSCNTNCGENKGKHPRSNNWPKIATTDEATIRRWFTRWPDSNVGITPPKGCIILDIDPRNGGDKTLEKLIGNVDSIETPTQRSGGGGWHYVFEGDLTKSPGKGIDLKRHKRGFVVAWPSTHKSGGTYKWVRDLAPWEADLSKVPAEFETEPYEPPKDDRKRKKISIELATVRAALAHVSADEYERWINYGQALKHAYGDDGFDIWVEWSQSSGKWNDGDERKWETFDLNRDRPPITVRSIVAYARRNGYKQSADEFADDLWVAGDIRDLLRTEAPPMDWTMRPCIPRAKVTLVSGAGGVSKSYLLLTLAVHLALGRGFGPFIPDAPGKALLLMAEEQREDIHRRIRSVVTELMLDDDDVKTVGDRLGVVSTRGHDWRLVELDNAGNVQPTDRVDYIIDQINSLAGEISMLVIDPLVAFNGVSENDNVQMAQLMLQLDRIAASTNCAVVVIHHMAKAGQVQTLAELSQAVVRGASALVDNSRSVLLMCRMPIAEAPLYNLNPDDAARFVVARVAKQNYGPMVPDTIFAVGHGGALRHAPEVVKVHASIAAAAKATKGDGSETLARVAKAMHDNPAASQRELSEKAGVHQTSISRHMHELVEREWAVRQGVGNSTRYKLTAQGLRAIGEGIDDLLGKGDR